MKITMNETRKAILDLLKGAQEPLTLAEISTLIDKKVSSGTTNPLVSAGLLKIVGEKEVQVVRTVKVNAYALGDVTIEDLESASKQEEKKEA